MSYTKTPKSFLTTREAAELLGVAQRTAQLWAEAGLLDGWKTDGGHRRITRVSVDRLLASPAAATAARLPAGSGEAVRILVAEDDPVMQALYAMKFASWDLPTEVAIVDDGFEALIRLGRAPVDLLVTDLHMPGMDGFHMLRFLAQSEELAGLTVVAVSGLDDEAIAVGGGIPAGIERLAKPDPFARLEAIAAGIFARRRAPLAPMSDANSGRPGPRTSVAPTAAA